MEYFKAMINFVRNNELTELDKEHFFECASKAIPFVILREPTQDTNKFNPDSFRDVENKNFDAPFAHFSVENYKGATTPVKISGSKDFFHVICSLYYEVSPKVFYTYFLAVDTKNKKVDLFHVKSSLLLDMHLEYINKQEIGFVKKKEKVRLGNGKNKYFHTINKIVYVKSKKSSKDFMSKVEENINWTHKFMVRGHWRKADKIGKDRAGEYVVPGFTWVTEHEKGEGVLIKKVRIVENTQTDQSQSPEELQK